MGIHLLRHFMAGDVTSWLSEQGGILNLFWSSEHWIAGKNNIFGQSIIMSGPALFHLWFLRDLIIAVICTPILYLMFAMRNGKHRRISLLLLILLGGLNLTRFQSTINGLSFETLFYFGLGSYLSLNGINLSEAFYKVRKPLALSFAIFYCLLAPLDGSRSSYGTIIMPPVILLGVMCVFNLAAWYTTRDFSSKFFQRYENTSFFCS